MRGASHAGISLLYENFVVMELVRSYSHDGAVAGLSFYRDADARAIDLVVEEGKRLHPFEVKKTASPKRPAAGLGALSKAEGFELSNGGVICIADAPDSSTRRTARSPAT